MKLLARLRSILRSLLVLVREHKLYFLAPTLLMLLAIAVLYIHLGPAMLISFIYAGL
jgi:hypothetical protein